MGDYKKYSKFVPYTVNGSVLKDISYKCTVETSGQAAEETLQYGALLKRIDGLENFEWDQFLSFDITSGQTVIKIECSGFASDILEISLRLLKNKRHCSGTTWYFFDKSRACDEPHFLHHFFITRGDEILLEDAKLSEAYDTKIPENLLVEPENREIWDTDADMRRAFAKLMYRKFYSETVTGKLMKILEEEDRAMVAAGMETTTADTPTDMHY